MSAQPTVSVVTATMRPENITKCLENFAKQTYAEKELLLVLNNSEFDVDGIRRRAEAIPNVRVLYVEGRTTLGDCLNLGTRESSGRYVAKMDDDNLYGSPYLSDLVLAAEFSDAEVTGKGSCYMYLEGRDIMGMRVFESEHSYAKMVAGSSLLVRRELLTDIPFHSISLVLQRRV